MFNSPDNVLLKLVFSFYFKVINSISVLTSAAWALEEMQRFCQYWSRFESTPFLLPDSFRWGVWTIRAATIRRSRRRKICFKEERIDNMNGKRQTLGRWEEWNEITTLAVCCWSCLSIVFTFNSDCKLNNNYSLKKNPWCCWFRSSAGEKNYYKNADIQ